MAKRVLMFSGGMDSFALKKIYSFSNDECLYIDIETQESKQEIKIIQIYFPTIKIIPLSLYKWELQNKIIPFRNHILALIGAQYANDIYFAFTAGDTTKDKDYIFKSQMEGILNYFGLDQNKISPNIEQNAPFSIQMPFKQLTKNQIIQKYIKKGFFIDELNQKSRSCYQGEKKACGKCRSCLRKFVALQLNNINQKELYQENPFNYLSEALRDAQVKNRKNEIEDIEKCINQKWQ